MLTRFLGGVTACLSLAGAATAQQPATLPSAPAAPPSAARMGTQSTFPTRVAATQLPAAPAPATPGTPVQAAPAMLPSNALMGGANPAATAPDPAGVCTPYGCPAQACGTACDCLCGPPGRVWVSAEWLYWVGRGQNTPAFITTSPAGTSRANAGVLGAPGTQTLFGGDKLNDNFRSGLRIRAGAWLDDCQRFGIEGDFFFLGNSGTGYAAGSDGSTILARPFRDVLGNANNAQLVAFGGQDSQLVAFPGVLAGSVGVRSSSDFIGGGLGFICNLCCDPCGRLDFVYGFRYLNLRDDITINENLTALPGSSVPAGTRFIIEDRIRHQQQLLWGQRRVQLRAPVRPLLPRRPADGRFGRDAHDRGHQRQHADHYPGRRLDDLPGRPADPAEQHRPLHQQPVLGRPRDRRAGRRAGD